MARVAVDLTLAAAHRLADLTTGPTALRVTDLLGVGDRWRLVAATGLARLHRPLDAWRLVVTVRERRGTSAKTVRAEARILSLSGEHEAARACLAETGDTGPTDVRTGSATGASPTTERRAADEPRAAPGDWSDLAPPAALRRLPRSARIVPLLGMLWRRRRFGASIWWARRRRIRRDEAEALLALGRFDEAERLVETRRRDRPTVLDLRILGEIHVRRGDLAAFDRLLEAATRHVPWRRRGLSPFAWAVTHFADHPAPAGLLPKATAERMIALAGRLDTARVQKRLSILFDQPFGRRLRALGGECATFSRPVARVSGGGRLPDDPTEAMAAIDTLLGRGEVSAAEEMALRHVDRRLARAQRRVGLAEVTALAGRFPTSRGLIERFADLARRGGRDDVVRSATDWMARVDRADWSGLVGSAAGRRCVVVGNGPSLAHLPLDRLHGTDLVCVNRGHEAATLGLPPPRHLVVADGLVYRRHKRAIDRAPVERLFLHGGCIFGRPKDLPDTVVPFGTSGYRFSHRPLDFAPWAFHRGDTVVVLAVQIAAVLGYTEIGVIGVDLDYGGERTHFYGGATGDRELLASFRPGGIGVEVVNAAFANLAEAVTARGGKLVNAGVGGHLHSLPRVSFENFTTRTTLTHEIR